jgi:mono/diheme cytochrome c family protein
MIRSLASAILWVALGVSSSVASEDLKADHLAIGERSYAMHCAACHGANLEGQPNWMRRLPNGRLPAPPHDKTGHTWHHTDDELFKITKFGLSAIVPDYQSDMPAYKSVLSDKEIFAVLEYIKSRWPARERRYQYNRTRKLKQ